MKNTPPTVADIRAKVIAVLSDVLADENLNEEMSVQDDLDSLDRITVLMALEDEFNISISESVARELRTVEDVATYIEMQANRPRPAIG